ncbi:ABC transporter substrate-binding protein [Azoarcus sp. L1K30]|uniref:ABC transporter substrate-binding protein n=1 Tax=Azoarcus sp. L1K30 TaxID=2820277 RepID=UPI001B81F62D|nr:ABC transporter substrate-binding protein [Azoarcus sp. L1K30]MBR0568099.1 ABC transporter substrate-binding protein [Azoarcus sp. L1K30]
MLNACMPPPEPLRFGANAWPGYASLRAAEVLGLITPAQLQVLDFPSTSMVLSAFRNGMIDVAGLTLDEALMLAAEEQAPRIILVFDFSAGADVVLAQPGIVSVAQLKGARVGVETEALGAYLIGRALAGAGLSAEDVDIVSIPLDGHESAFVAGQVDALVTFDPVRSSLLARGAKLLFSSRAIPGEIVDVLVVRAPLLARRKADLRALVDAHFAGRARMLANPADVAAKLEARLSLSEAQFRAALGLMEMPDVPANRRLLGQGEGGLAATLERMGQVMRSLGLLEQVPVLDALLVPDLIPEY